MSLNDGQELSSCLAWTLYLTTVTCMRNKHTVSKSRYLRVSLIMAAWLYPDSQLYCLLRTEMELQLLENDYLPTNILTVNSVRLFQEVKSDKGYPEEPLSRKFI